MNTAEGVEVPRIGSDRERHMPASGLGSAHGNGVRHGGVGELALDHGLHELEPGHLERIHRGLSYWPRPPGYDDATAGTSRDGRVLRTMGSSRMKSTITVASNAQAPAA